MIAVKSLATEVTVNIPPSHHEGGDAADLVLHNLCRRVDAR